MASESPEEQANSTLSIELFESRAETPARRGNRRSADA